MFSKSEQEIMKNWIGDKTLPVVSICSITYNHEKYIKETINSFLMQETDFPFEIVIGEDCSTDNTKKILEQYIKKYPNIVRLITSSQNVGGEANFERTLRAAKSEYIAYCEGDDFWNTSNKLMLQYYSMKKGSYTVSFHSIYIYKEQNSFKNICNQHYKKEQSIDAEELIINGCGYSYTASLMFKKSSFLNVLNQINQYPPFFDCFFTIMCTLNGKALFLPSPMSTYRIHSEGWTQKRDKDYLLVMKEYTKYISLLNKVSNNKHRKAFKYNLSKMYHSTSQYFSQVNDQKKCNHFIKRSLNMKPVYYGTLIHYYKLRKLPKFAHRFLKKVYSFYSKLGIR